MGETTERTYVVEGMTCNSCRLNVTEEVEELPGVEHVDVELASGRMTVRGTGLDDAAIRAAVDEAGYAVQA